LKLMLYLVEMIKVEYAQLRIANCCGALAENTCKMKITI